MYMQFLSTTALDNAMTEAYNVVKSGTLSIMTKFICPVLALICFVLLIWCIFKAFTTWNDDPDGKAFRGWIFGCIFTAAGGILLTSAAVIAILS